MKLLILLFTFFILTTYPGAERMNNQNKNELFMEVAGDKSKNWLQLTYSGDHIVGIFFGVEKQADGSHVYYRSAMEKLTLDRDNIQFVLSTYCFSKKPFTDTAATNIECADPDPNLPGVLLFSQNFSGKKSSSRIVLRRVSPLYDSKFDEFIMVHC